MHNLESPPYAAFVWQRIKDAMGILTSLDQNKIDLWHMATGISGESGEFLDCIKKHVVYNQPLNRENAIEELGDIEFYLEGARQVLGISREDILSANRRKLEKRYPVNYTDAAAKERADKP